MTVIRCTAEDLMIIKDYLAKGKKIAAIKHLRLKGQINGEKGVGLKDAKYAVESLDGRAHTTHEYLVKIAPLLKVISFKVKGSDPDSVVEVDLDGLQLMMLDGLSQLPLSDIAEMTALISYIRKWQGDLLDDE